MSIDLGRAPNAVRRVAIAGATGFVGRALTERLIKSGHHVIALSRRPIAESQHADACTWRQANLFQLRDVERALEGADEAVYLVHSMLPSARLSQGDFADLDLVCADNFARAAKRAGVARITYVGGLLPQERPLSAHLKSRLEVEQALAGHGVPLISMRAGIVFGAGGSSAEMLLHLVERLPVLVLPRWCQSLCQPTSIDDLVRVLCQSLERPVIGSDTIDVGNEDVLSYSDMLRHTARALGKRRLFLPVPAFTPSLSLWWVSWVTSTPMALVAPLVGSLLHDMVVRPAHDVKQHFDGPWKHFDESLTQALAHRRDGAPTGSKRTPAADRARGVVSVQRFVRPQHMNAEQVARHYVSWLTHSTLWLTPFVRIVSDEGPTTGEAVGARQVRFYLRGINVLLLKLDFAPTRSDPDRQLFYIAGGWLTRPTDKATPGRFEFRSVLGNRYVLAAIYDFVPRLPWALYKATQASVHALVMAGFRRHLRRLAAEAEV